MIYALQVIVLNRDFKTLLHIVSNRFYGDRNESLQKKKRKPERALDKCQFMVRLLYFML